MALLALLFFFFPLVAFADDGSGSRFALVALLYGLGFILTILILVIIAKKKAVPDESSKESPKIKMQ